MAHTSGALVLALLLAAGCASGALAQDSVEDDQAPGEVSVLVRAGREAARRGDYEDATEALSRARELSPEPSSLEIELALSAWQAGQDARAAEVLEQSSSEEAPLLSEALRLREDLTLVLAQSPAARRRARAELDLTHTELEVASGFYWSSALGGTASFLVPVVSAGVGGDCSSSCQAERTYTAVGLATASFAFLLGGIALSIDGAMRRDRWRTQLRASADGLAWIF